MKYSYAKDSRCMLDEAIHLFFLAAIGTNYAKQSQGTKAAVNAAKSRIEAKRFSRKAEVDVENLYTEACKASRKAPADRNLRYQINILIEHLEKFRVIPDLVNALHDYSA